MLITMTREELRDMLQLTENGIKTLVRRGKLDEKLRISGYKLENTYKIGRNTIYELSIIDTNEWMEIQNKYNIKKKNEHNKYSKARIENGNSSRSKLIKDNNIHISGKTAKRYDTILCKEDIMEHDKEVYYLIDSKTNVMTEITEEEYKDFWHNNMTAKNSIQQINKQLDNKEITGKQADIYKHKILEKVDNKEGCIAVKYDTYKQATNAIKILELINRL